MMNRYAITLRSHLSARIVAQLGDFRFSHQPTGNTVLTTEPLDQAGLYGLVNRCRDLGLTLVAVNPLPDQDAK